MKYSIIAFALISSLLISCGSVSKKTSDGESEAVGLPDGSIALLNENSSIVYDSKFESRTVEQTGEVFYVVKKGSVPFVVETENGKIQVLGTEFNVKSSDDELEVEVEKGTVEVESRGEKKKVNRGQKASTKKGDNGLHLGKAEYNFQQWTKQLERDLKALEKELQKAGEEVSEEADKLGKSLKKEFDKLGN